jgi:hypothetical protein
MLNNQEKNKYFSSIDSLFKLPPHVDGGELEMWSDPNYRQVYQKIYENFDDYDPFEVDYRTQINLNELRIANGCTFFRYVKSNRDDRTK